jgi:hypothetical protein
MDHGLKHALERHAFGGLPLPFERNGVRCHGNHANPAHSGKPSSGSSGGYAA